VPGDLGTGGRSVFVGWSRWQRAVSAAILVISLLAVVLLSTLAWITWPFLVTGRRTAVLDFLDRLIERIKILGRIGYRRPPATGAPRQRRRPVSIVALRDRPSAPRCALDPPYGRPAWI
jgi:hypothetical protein